MKDEFRQGYQMRCRWYFEGIRGKDADRPAISCSAS